MKRLFSPLYSLISLVVGWLTIDTCVCLWAFCPVLLIYVSVIVPVPYCFDEESTCNAWDGILIRLRDWPASRTKNVLLPVWGRWLWCWVDCGVRQNWIWILISLGTVTYSFESEFSNHQNRICKANCIQVLSGWNQIKHMTYWLQCLEFSMCSISLNSSSMRRPIQGNCSIEGKTCKLPLPPDIGGQIVF